MIDLRPNSINAWFCTTDKDVPTPADVVTTCGAGTSQPAAIPD